MPIGIWSTSNAWYLKFWMLSCNLAEWWSRPGSVAWLPTANHRIHGWASDISCPGRIPKPTQETWVLQLHPLVINVSRVDGVILVIALVVFLFDTLNPLELRPILPAVTPLALLALWLAFPAVTPQHCYDAPPTNGKAPLAPLTSAARRTCTESFMACIWINQFNKLAVT